MAKQNPAAVSTTQANVQDGIDDSAGKSAADAEAKARAEQAAKDAADAEARAKKEAADRAATEAEAERRNAEAATLVAMLKDGQTLRVHPTCVQSHRQAGWKVA